MKFSRVAVIGACGVGIWDAAERGYDSGRMLGTGANMHRDLRERVVQAVEGEPRVERASHWLLQTVTLIVQVSPGL